MRCESEDISRFYKSRLTGTDYLTPTSTLSQRQVYACRTDLIEIKAVLVNCINNLVAKETVLPIKRDPKAHHQLFCCESGVGFIMSLHGFY